MKHAISGKQRSFDCAMLMPESILDLSHYLLLDFVDFSANRHTTPCNCYRISRASHEWVRHIPRQH